MHCFYRCIVSFFLLVNTSYALNQRYEQKVIESFDGAKIGITIFQPQLAESETAPLVLHSHGFSFSRMDSPESLYARKVLSGQVAMSLWKSGYWVVSFDQRGHGDSDAQVQLMSPDYEVKDASVVIDWVLEHLPNVAKEPADPKDPIIGMIGESYGGALQLLLTLFDPRIDAIVPMHTWYDLNQAVYPNHIPKKWLGILAKRARKMQKTAQNPLLSNWIAQSFEDKQQPIELERFMDVRSMKYYCESGYEPHADALVVAGFRDTLFGMNQVMGMQQCWQKSEYEFQLLGTQGGHLLPFVQYDGFKTVYSIEEQIVCDGKSLHLQSQMRDWFDHRLKGAEMPTEIPVSPNKCFSIYNLDSENGGVILDQLPVEGDLFEFSSVHIKHRWFDRVGLGPKFVPLYQVEAPEKVIGIPVLSIADVAVKQPTRLFVGLAVKKGARIRVLNDQVVPIELGNFESSEVKSSPKQPLEWQLNAVSRELKPGEVLGLVFYTYNRQFSKAGSKFGAEVSFSGSVQVPLM